MIKSLPNILLTLAFITMNSKSINNIIKIYLQAPFKVATLQGLLKTDVNVSRRHKIKQNRNMQ